MVMGTKNQWPEGSILYRGGHGVMDWIRRLRKKKNYGENMRKKIRSSQSGIDTGGKMISDARGERAVQVFTTLGNRGIKNTL